VVCLPTAAGQEGDESVDRWLNMGVEHFRALGAEVTPARITDRESADAPQWESALEAADLIYFSGGNPIYLYETLQGTLAWTTAQKAWERGAVYAGCSAGAMILAQRVANFRAAGLTSKAAFQVIPVTFVIPHFDRIRGVWSAFFFAVRRQLRDDQFILGVDENTALVGKLEGVWQVMGQGQAHIITREGQIDFNAGEEVPLSP
jgi:cyanophycinase